MNTLNDLCKVIVDQSDDDVIQIPIEYIVNFSKYFEFETDSGEYVSKMFDVETVDGWRRVPIIELTGLAFTGQLEIDFDDENIKEIFGTENIKEAKTIFDLPKFIIDAAEQFRIDAAEHARQMQRTGNKKSIEQVEAEITAFKELVNEQ